ncbi:hypothetical protein L218DRAFT_739554 [Marasmius fiardii PR-910]|nr:hypothetical protein L218DRAFT_739554 [Marasmius fiardii PR-910]
MHSRHLYSPANQPLQGHILCACFLYLKSALLIREKILRFLPPSFDSPFRSGFCSNRNVFLDFAFRAAIVTCDLRCCFVFAIPNCTFM